MKTKINGDTWTFKVLTAKQMKKAGDGEAAAGLCEPTTKSIFINENYLTYGTVAHEIFHAYFTGLHLEDTTGVAMSDLEEICATMFENKGDRMVKQAKRVFKALRGKAT